MFDKFAFKCCELLSNAVLQIVTFSFASLNVWGGPNLLSDM